MRKRTWKRLILRTFIVGALTTALSVMFHYVLHANSTTAALSYLLLVLGAATLWGLPEAMLTSAMSILNLDYYFLPPVPAIGIDDPQNWVSWGTFIITAFVVSELSSRLRNQAFEATGRRREIERLYTLSRSLMQSSSAADLAESISGQVAVIFGCPGVAFFDALSGRTYQAGIAAKIPEEALKTLAGDPEWTGTNDSQTLLVPVRLATLSLGALGFAGTAISFPAAQSIANLVAMAIDRVRKQEAVAQAESARRHQELKSMLLDAMAHEFQTPLTSIRAGIDAMLADSPGHDQREWLEIMDEETGRLTSMMTESIQVARIEAGQLDLDKQPHTVEDLVYSALKRELAAPSQIEIEVPAELPPVTADAGMIRLVIREFARNARKYSQPDSPITVRAHAEQGGVVISVADRGPGIPAEEQRQIFEEYYRGKQKRGDLSGMGMGLHIASQVVEAHDGRVWVQSQTGEGATFSFILPIAHEEASV